MDNREYYLKYLTESYKYNDSKAATAPDEEQRMYFKGKCVATNHLYMKILLDLAECVDSEAVIRYPLSLEGSVNRETDNEVEKG